VSDSFVGFVEKVGAGSWPEWVAAIGTSVALLVAALTYASDARARRQAQARLVYAKVASSESVPADRAFKDLSRATITHGDVSMDAYADRYGNTVLKATAPFVLVVVEVHNRSQELIGPTTIRARDLRSGKPWGFQLPIGYVEPGAVEVAELYCSNPLSPASPSMGVDVRFRDASGRWWKRVGHDPIEEIHDDPENVGMGSAERAKARRLTEKVGIPTVPERKPSVRVWMHRVGRGLRGKEPIP
jgi:hypothetical protein